MSWTYVQAKKMFVGKTNSIVTRTLTYQPSNNQSSLTPIINTNSFINHVWTYTYSKEDVSPLLSTVSEDQNPTKTLDFYTNLPLFSGTIDTIKIPNKVEYAIKRHIPKKFLRSIHPNIDVATELCLLFLSQLTSTYFTWKDGSNIDGWKSLKAEYIRELVFIEPNTYKKIREALETKLWDGPILECDYVSERWAKCYNYRLGSNYIGKGISSYVLKTPEVKQLNTKNRQRQFKSAVSNTIARNLIILYSMIELPWEEEIMKNSKELVKNGYKTKKGKTLTLLNKHSKGYFKDHENRSFVEDNLTTYNYLTEGGLMIPTIGSAESGGRVIDSLSLMPGFIRNMIKIEGKPIVECDYSCLHPNIAVGLYGGSDGYITHQKVAEETGIDLATIKREHLSFFNKHPKQMEKSPLFEYYTKKDTQLMKNLINEKYNSKRKYKITSEKMMSKEVRIINDVIQVLNQEGIYVGYTYDALFCIPDQAPRVKSVMDEQAKKHGVMTNAKISSPHAS